MDDLARIESHFGVTLPRGYRAWVEAGYVTLGSASYLWVFDARWLPPEEIPTRNLKRKLLIEGLIPFARSGAGDHWVWNTTRRHGDDEYEVLFCWHDDDLADAYAPTFPAWSYRNCLQFAAGGFNRNEDGIREAQQHFAQCSELLGELGHENWSAHLGKLASSKPFEFQNPKLRIRSFGFITDMDIESIVQAEFGDRYVGTKVDWGVVA